MHMQMSSENQWPFWFGISILNAHRSFLEYIWRRVIITGRPNYKTVKFIQIPSYIQYRFMIDRVMSRALFLLTRTVFIFNGAATLHSTLRPPCIIENHTGSQHRCTDHVFMSLMSITTSMQVGQYTYRYTHTHTYIYIYIMWGICDLQVRLHISHRIMRTVLQIQMGAQCLLRLV